MANDVKVTLTADDQATEIVRKLAGAVKQLDAQQRSSNAGLKDAASASRSAAGAFGDFQRAIGAVAAALGAIRVIDFVRDTVQATDEIGKLSLKTGATTEALSVLSVAASTADLSQQDLANGLKFLARSFTELQQGVPQTAAAFQALGLSAKDLKGLSLDQVLVRLADAQAKFGDGAGKTAALLKIFGRSGEELIPLLHDLSNGGFDEAAKKAKDLGLVIGSEDAKAARDFDDALKTLTNSAKGVVVQLTPLIKGATDVAEAIAKFVAQHPAIAAFGGAAAIAAAGITILSVAVGGLAVAVGALDVSLAPVLITLAALVVLAGGAGLIAAAIHKARVEAEGLAKASKDTAGAQNSTLPQVVLPDPAQIKAALEAQLAATRQNAKDKLAAVQSGIAKEQELNNAAFAQGLESLQAFYAKRISLTNAGVAAEIKELEAEKKALASSPLSENTDAARIKRASEIKALEAQIAKLKIDGQTQVLGLIEQQRVAEKALAQELQGFQQQILTAQGNIIASDRIKIEQSVEAFKLALTKAAGGAGKITADVADEINKLGAAFSTLLTNQAAFAQAQRQSGQQLNELDIARAQIRAKAAAGLISERQADLDIAATERDRIPALQKAADLMQFFGEQLNNPEMKIAAAQLKAEIAGLGHNLSQSAQDIRDLKDNLLDASRSGLGNFLGSAIDQVHSVGEAFANLLLSISQGFQQVLGKLIADKAIDALSKLFNGGGNVAAPTIALGAAGATVTTGAVKMGESATALGVAGAVVLKAAEAMGFAAAALAAAVAAQAGNSAANLLFLTGGFATGGPVKGPGTGTSDSILARLSAGEYVLRADAVRKLGIPFLDALNGLRTSSLRRFSAGLPGFATGGLVSGGGGSASVSGGLDITVSAAPGSSLDALRTSGGLKVLREVIGGNPQMFKAALGLT